MRLHELTEGYGPANLVEEVRRSGWIPCEPNGEHFQGIDLKGYYLVKEKDLLCPQRFRMIFFEVLAYSGDQITVEGYQEPFFIEHSKYWDRNQIRFGKNLFVLEFNNHLYEHAYRLIIEEI